MQHCSHFLRSRVVIDKDLLCMHIPYFIFEYLRSFVLQFILYNYCSVRGYPSKRYQSPSGVFGSRS